MALIKPRSKYTKIWTMAIILIAFIPAYTKAQDTSSSILNLDKLKIVKKAQNLVDSAKNKLNEKIFNKINNATKDLNNKINEKIKSIVPKEDIEERPLPYEVLLNKKYNLPRRAYQNTVSQFNYLFNAEEELNEIIQNARNQYKEDFENLLNFYDYDLATTSKYSNDSIIYRCNANIVLHDLRSNWVDDAYLTLAKSYIYHRNFDTAGSILQFINYSFDENAKGMELPMGSNLRNESGRFSIVNKDDYSFWKNRNIRNESMIWQARNYNEANEINEALSLLQILKADVEFPKRLQPFLHEQFAYTYYKMGSYELAAINLIEALPNALDNNAKSRWYFLIAQLWQKANNTSQSYLWFKKAAQFSPNPIIGVYATINLTRIESEKSNSNWQSLAKDLELLSKKEKYKPYRDIIYYEMANLAIQNKSYDIANNWLIVSIKNNYDNPKQKQSAFELMGSINYKINNFNFSKIAYDSISNVIKTNPDFEIINLRKKWLSNIVEELAKMETEDSLQFIYQMPPSQQNIWAINWQKRKQARNKFLKNIFLEPAKESIVSQTQSQTNTFAPYSNNKSGNFYFENNNTIIQGKQIFIQKWGERPNVDNWRRKTSTTVVNSDMSAINTVTTSNNLKFKVKEDKNDSLLVKLITDEKSFEVSRKNWNNAALTSAQIFLIKLNDFEKAKSIYKLIIEKNIDSTITERAFLDMASEYLHIGDKETSDNIIRIVTNRFPNGIYQQKKKEADTKLSADNNIDKLYKECLFFSQIGNWSDFENIANSNTAIFSKSKWFFPLQFLKVKMYAQSKQDDQAINLLDSIIKISNNEIYKEKATSLIFEIRNRKNTEQYLTSLQFEKMLDDSIEIKSSDASLSNSNVNQANLLKQPQPITNIDSNKDQKIIPNKENVANIKKIITPSRFILDSTENYYIALVTNNTNAFIATRIKDSLLNKYKIEFVSQKINSSIAQLQEKSFVIWIGPFQNAFSCINYYGNFAPSLIKGLNDYISIDKYSILTIGKSNIVKLKTLEDFNEYKKDTLNNIIKN